MNDKKKTLKILMIDDHPSMIDGYKLILSFNDLDIDIETTAAYTCQNAYEIITKKTNKNYFDLAFLDYNLPVYEDKNIKNGEDLGLILRDFSPDTKIIMLTSHTEAILLHQIVRKLEPEGLLVKSDFTADELLNAFGLILDKQIYYSATVKNILKELLTPENFLNNLDKQILSLIGQGVRTKNLPGLLNLTISAIEKRKTHIRTFLNVSKNNDDELIKEARKRGLI